MSEKNKILESFVHKVVESTFFGLKKQQQQNKSALKVPPPKNPIKAEPKGPLSTKDILSLLNKIEEMQSLEDLSREDKFHLAKAKEIISGVVSGQSIKEK